MVFDLFHKNIKVLSVDYEPKTNRFGKINEIYEKNHVPVGVSDDIQFWWDSRLIPKNRNIFKHSKVDISSLLAASYGFNLSDQYWLRPEHSDMTWDKGNFYTNSFDEDIGKYIAGKSARKFGHMSSDSPDLFSNGEQDKRWTIFRDKRVLIKYGQPPFYEQPFNEVLASWLCRRLGFPYISYSFISKGSVNPEIYSVCPCFVDKDTEFVPAGFIQYVQKKEKSDSFYKHILKCCKKLGMPDIDGIKKFLAQMMLLDYIMANTDRHFGNFGFIRNAETLEWQGPAPIFDTGNSMFYDYPTSDLRKSVALMENVPSKCFARTQKEQLRRFAKDIAFLDIDFNLLKGVDGFYKELLAQNPKTDEERRELLASLLLQRIDSAKSIIYSNNDVILLFLEAIADDTSPVSLSQKIASARSRMIKKDISYQVLLDSYLRSLNAQDPEDLEDKIRKLLKNV